MKSRYNVILFFLALGLIINCGGASTGTSASGGTTTDDSAQLTSVDDLPEATGPVVESTSSSLSLASGDAAYLATTGMPLRNTDGDDFDSSSSLAACEMFNMTKAAIQNAAQGDLILCYVKNTFPVYLAQAESEIDIADGEYHVFDLDFTGLDFEEPEGDQPPALEEGEPQGEEDPSEMEGPDHVKFKIVKNDDGFITGFEMFACENGEQVEYLNQSIDGADFSMTSKGTHSQGEDSSDYETTVSATLDSNNQFVDSKEIIMKFVGSFQGSEQWGLMRFNQMPDSATLTGYMNGSFSDGEQSHGFTNQVVGSVQLLDPNVDGEDYDIGVLALGDGAVKFMMHGDDDEWHDEGAEAWLGDTIAVTDTSDFLDDVESADLPEETQPTLSFATGQSYGCDETAETTIVFADLFNSAPSASESAGDTEEAEEFEEHQQGFQACMNLELQHNWINCWERSGDEM